MIAVTGATGQLGHHAVKALLARVPADQLVALVRSPEKATKLGITVRRADYAAPETLEDALSGIDKLLLISSSEVGQRAVQHRNVIEAAKHAGVQLIAYTSLLHADTSPLNLAEEHRDTEAALKASGIPYVLLRNGWYTENYTGSIPGALVAGAFTGSAGDGLVSTATRADLAEAAAVVLTTDGHADRTYELAGDKAYTLTEFAAELSRQTGKDIPYQNLPEADYAAALQKFGLPADLAGSIASWDYLASKGALFDDSQQLSTLIGRPTTPLSAAISEALNA